MGDDDNQGNFARILVSLDTFACEITSWNTVLLQLSRTNDGRTGTSHKAMTVQPEVQYDCPPLAIIMTAKE